MELADIQEFVANETQEVQEPQQEQEVQNDNQVKPEGWDQVEFTPEQQKRFDRVYGQVKTMERELKEARQFMKDQAKALMTVQQGQQQIASHIVDTSFSQKESQLIEARKAAFEKGDLEAFTRASDEIAELKLEKKFAAQKPQKPEVQVQEDKPISADDIVNMALQEGEITHNDITIYQSWARETDQFGQPLRPWINQMDMRNSRAAYIAAAVANDPSMEGKTMAQKLMEIDKLMGVQKVSQQNVMPGGANLTRPNKVSNIKLPPDIEKMAVQTQFAGLGKSPAEHVEAYRQVIARAKGGR